MKKLLSVLIIISIITSYLPMSLSELMIAEAATFSLITEADATVQGGSGANINSGTSDTLVLSGSFYRMIYLRFDLSFVPSNVSSAKFFLSGYNAPLYACLVANDNWDEETITMNNRPLPVSTPNPLNDISAVLDSTGKKMVFDVTSFLNTEYSGDKKLTLMIYTTATSGNYYYNSKEKSSGWPEISYAIDNIKGIYQDNNLLNNPGFDIDTNVDGIPNNWAPKTWADSGTMALDTTVYKSQNNSVKITGSSSTSEVGYIVSPDFPLLLPTTSPLPGKNMVAPNQPCQFSSYIKTNGTLSSGSYASMKVTYTTNSDGSGEIETVESDHITDSKDGFKYIFIDSVSPDTSTNLFVWVSVRLKGTGTVWYDDTYFEIKNIHNLIPNGSAEYNRDGDNLPDHWLPAPNSSWDTTQVYEGTHSFKLTPSNTSSLAKWYSDFIPVFLDDRYSYSVWVKTDRLTKNAYITFEFFDSNNNQLKTYYSNKITGTNSWTEITGEQEVPFEATTMRMGLIADGSGEVWYDKVYMSKNSFNHIKNPSAEYNSIEKDSVTLAVDNYEDGNLTSLIGNSEMGQVLNSAPVSPYPADYMKPYTSVVNTPAGGLAGSTNALQLNYVTDNVSARLTFPINTIPSNTKAIRFYAKVSASQKLYVRLRDASLRNYQSAALAGATPAPAIKKGILNDCEWHQVTLSLANDFCDSNGSGGRDTSTNSSSVQPNDINELWFIGYGKSPLTVWIDNVEFITDTENQELEGWSGRKWSGTGPQNFWNATNSYSGGKSLQTTTTNGTDCAGWSSDKITVKPGASYKYTGYASTLMDASVAPNPTPSAGLFVVYYDSDGNMLTEESSNKISGNTKWTKLTINSTAPPNAATVEVQGRIMAKGTAWFDDFCMEGPIKKHPDLIFGSEDIPNLQAKWSVEPFKTNMTSDYFKSDYFKYIKDRTTANATNVKNLLMPQLQSLVKSSTPIGNYGSERTGRRVQDWVAQFDAIYDSGVLSDHEKAEVRENFVSITNAQINTEYGDYGNNNRNVDRYAGVGMVGVSYTEYTLSDSYINHAKSYMYADLNGRTLRQEDGSWPETTRYVDVVCKTLATLGKVFLRYDGSNVFDNPNFKKMFKNLMNIRTPLDPVNTAVSTKYPRGKVSAPAIGDANWGEISYGVLSWIAPEYKQSDLTFSQNLMDVWHNAGEVVIGGNVTYGMFSTDLTITPEPPALTSEIQSGIGYILFRNKVNTPNEDYMIMHAPPVGYYHRHFDVGSYSIFSDSIPLMLDTACNDYNGSIRYVWQDSTQGHNAIGYKDATGTIINGADTNAVVENFSTTNFVDSTLVKIPDSSATRHERQITFLKGGLRAYVVFDSIDSKNRSISNLHTMSSTSSILNNKITANCSNNKDVEITVLSPENPDIQKSSEPMLAPPAVNVPPIQDVFTVEALPGVDHLSVIYPKNSTDNGLTSTPLTFSNNNIKGYKMQKDNGEWFIALYNQTSTADVVSIDANAGMTDVVTGTSTMPITGKVNLPIAGNQILVLVDSNYYINQQTFTCDPVTNLVATPVAEGGISLNWEEPSVFGNYKVKLCYKKETDIDWQSINLDAGIKNYLFTSLDYTQKYNFSLTVYDENYVNKSPDVNITQMPGWPEVYNVSSSGFDNKIEFNFTAPNIINETYSIVGYDIFYNNAFVKSLDKAATSVAITKSEIPQIINYQPISFTIQTKYSDGTNNSTSAGKTVTGIPGIIETLTLSADDAVINEQKVQLTVNVHNNTNLIKTTTLIAGMYDNNERLLQAICQTNQVDNNADMPFIFQFNYPGFDLFHFKVFSWSDMRIMLPMAKPIK